MEQIDQIWQFVETETVKSFAVFVRFAAFFALMPGFGEQTIPARVKLGLALALTLAVAPAIGRPDPALSTIWMIFSEVISGVFFGLSMRLFLMALQTAGSIAAQATSLSQLLGGSAAEPLPALGHVLVVSGLALISILGLHVSAVQFFILTYELVPMGQMPNPSIFGEWGMTRVAQAFTLAFNLAAPFIILSVIYNLALGAINRAMPQLMVAFVGAPLITGGSLALLLVASPFMLAAWADALSIYMQNPGGILR